MPDPTRTTYGDLTDAYDFLNVRLFEARLPLCLITMQRRAKSNYGHFCGERFGTRDGREVTDEISLNPRHLRNRAVDEILSTLAHEMVHLEQHHFGKASRSGYHNKEWGSLMQRIGLEPSSTGKPGGRRTGQQMSHYVASGGRFEDVCRELLATGFTIHYGDQLPGEDRSPPESKVKYTCPQCGANAWGKPALSLICGDCAEPMNAAGH